MAEKRPRPAKGDRDAPGFDQELNLRAIIGAGLGIALITALVLALLWPLLGFFRRERVALDPAPSPMPEANEPRLPPEPRLQPAPTLDMETLRSREDATLRSYGWVDRPAGIGRIPIDRAIDIVAETGLPEAPPAAAPRRRR